MSTTIRPELSEKNKYWIDHHRYYELKHFCLQYPAWKKAYGVLDGLSKRPNDNPILAKLNVVSDPTARCAVTKAYLAERIAMIEDVAEDRCRWKSDGKMRMRRVKNLYLPGNRFVSVTLKSLHFLLFFRKNYNLYYEKIMKGDSKYVQNY